MLFQRKAVNDPDLCDRENDHRAALDDEHRKLECRFLFRLARGNASADVLVTTDGRRERRHLALALLDHPRLLIIGGRWSGKTTLASFLLAQASRHDMGFGDHAPFAVKAQRLRESELDEESLVELNPAAGHDVLLTALEAGRALVVVDGLDEARSPDKLKRSIAALAVKYPYSRFVVFSRPLPARIAGRHENLIDGFVTATIAGPDRTAGATVFELHPRSPAERVASLSTEVEGLLERWHIHHLPPGNTLRYLTERGRFLVACHLAADAYCGRLVELTDEVLARGISAELATASFFEETEQILHEDEHPNGGEPIAEKDSLSRRMVEDIRAFPGVLIERRPGIFAFASLAVQQYLTAAFFAKEGLLVDLLETSDDPWWHPVFVIAAGLPAPFSSVSPARVWIAALLRQRVKADSVATYLADQAAVVAPFLPVSLRRDIDRRLRAALPIDSDAQLIHLVTDIGEIAAPAVIGALAGAGVNERARMLTALGRLDHPDVLRALVRHASDEERTTELMLCWAWNVDAVAAGLPVGFFAFAAFFNLALNTPAGDALFDQVLAKTSDETRHAFIDLVVRKYLNDHHWGREHEEDRDPWRSAAFMEKIMARGAPSPR